jgi:hypothetical protein
MDEIRGLLSETSGVAIYSWFFGQSIGAQYIGIMSKVLCSAPVSSEILLGESRNIRSIVGHAL